MNLPGMVAHPIVLDWTDVAMYGVEYAMKEAVWRMIAEEWKAEMDPKDKYEKPLPDDELPRSVGGPPSDAEMEDGGDDPAEVEEG